MKNGGAAWKLTKSKLSFALGSVILLYEVMVRQGSTRPYVLLAGLTLCGVASFLHLDDLLTSRGVSITLNRDEQQQREPLPNGGDGSS